MTTTSALMTVEQYSALPEPSGGFYELHHGVPVFVTRPKHHHAAIQNRLADFLRGLAADRGKVWTEFAFRPLPEYEVWSADVAFVSAARFRAIDPNDYLGGAPELVIEVVSPSNTAQDMLEREAICLENGCLEFWLVDPKRKTVKVSTPDRMTITYIGTDTIPLHVPVEGQLAVAAVFD